MANRFLAVLALGLAFGLTACDKGGQEQAQQPQNPPAATQEQKAPPAAAGPQQGMAPESAPSTQGGQNQPQSSPPANQ